MKIIVMEKDCPIRLIKGSVKTAESFGDRDKIVKRKFNTSRSLL